MKYVVGIPKNLNVFRLLVAFIFLNATLTFAGPNRTTYQAKIVKPDGYPLESSSVNFKFTILNPAGDCILYSETYSSVNMSSTGGLISFSLGSGVKTYPVSATTFEQVFSNITPTLSCEAGAPATYSPASSDARKIVMQFHDGAGWQTLPAMSINAVPYAMYANEASSLNGKTEADFVALTAIPTCLSTEALQYNGTSFVCVSTTNVSGAAVVAALGYTPATGASVTALSSSLSTTDATVASVSSAVFSVSSTVSTLSNAVAASFSAITSSQWITSGTAISYNSGNVGIGTTTPVTKLEVSGGVRISMETAVCAVSFAGTLRYNSGLVEYCNGTSWSAFGVAGAGITLFNGSASGTQTFVTGISGTNFNITTNSGVHSFNIPLAASAAVTAGLLSNSDYATFNAKMNATSAAVVSAMGYTPANSSTVATLTSNLNTVSSTVASLTNSTAASFSAMTSSQWVTSGSTINYPTGYVGVGTANPARPFHVRNTMNALQLDRGDNDLPFVLLVRYPDTSYGTPVQTWKFGGDQTGSNDFHISDLGTAIGGNGTPRLSVKATTGYIGIGTSNPTSNLQIGATTVSMTTTPVTFSMGGTYSASAGMNAKLKLYDLGSGIPYGIGVSTARMDFITPTGAGFNFFVNGVSTPSVVMHPTGRVGIGTESPLAPLDVSGTIRSAITTDGNFFTLQRTSQRIHYVQGSGQILRLISDGPSTYDFQLEASTGNIFMATGFGNVGVGVASPNAKLHLSSGTSTVAPLKITSGTLLAAAQAGAVEYDGFYYYITDGAGVRRSIATVANPGTYDNASVISSSGNITMTPVGSVIVSSTTASTNSSTGALVVNGGLGVAGNIYSSGTIITSSNIQGSEITATSATITPRIYGSIVSGGSLRLDSTTHATKGSILLAPTGGNVGIGTITPTNPLHVSGFDNSGTGIMGVVENTAASGQPSAGFLYKIAGVNYGSIAGSSFTNTAFGITTGLNLSAGTATQDIGFRTGSAVTGAGSGPTMIIKPSGNVGIGTNAPAKKLHVVGDNTTDYLMQIESPNDSAAAVFVTSQATGDYAGFAVRRISSSGDGWNVGMGPADNNFVMTSRVAGVNNDRLVVTSAGNVGIGTSAPTTKLDVIGAAGSGHLFTVTNTSASAGYSGSFNLAAPNLANGETLFFNMGKAASTNNRAAVTYVHAADGSTSNRISLGLFGNDNILNIVASGSVGIGTTAPTAKLTIIDNNSTPGQNVFSAQNTNASGAGQFSARNNGTGQIFMQATGSSYTGTPSLWNKGTIFTSGNLTALNFLTNGELGTGGTAPINFTAGGYNNIPAITVTPGSPGNVGVGFSAPSARLHLVSGSTTVAPLKFTSGSLVVSPASGAIEYDGFYYYITDGANTRRAIATVANPGTYDDASNISSSGNITMTPVGSVVVSSTTASTNSQTGALIVKGGLGVAGNIYSSGTIITSSNIEGNGIKTKGTTAYLEMHDTDTLYSANPQSALVFRDSGNSQYSFMGPSNGSMIWNSWLPIELDTTGGVDLYVSLSGKVGIGTSSPTSNLEIAGSIADNTAALKVGGSASAPISGTYGSSKISMSANFAGYGAGPRAINLYPTAQVDGHGIGLSNGLTELYSNGNFGFFVRPNRADVNATYASNEVVRITSTGRMGIGTSAPATQLHIKGTGPYIAFEDSEDPNGSYGSITQFQDGKMYYDADFNNTATVGGHVFRTDGATNTIMTMTSSGNVGVGNTSPTYKFQVQKTASATPAMMISGGHAGGPRFQTYGLDADALAYMGLGTDMSGSIYEHSIYTSGVSQSGKITFGQYDGTTFTERMRIHGNGNVGIGTNNPLSKLEIKGSDLGGNMNDAVEMQRWTGSLQTNVSMLDVRHIRTTSGTNWFSAGTRIQEKIDATWMGYMQFNGTGNEGGISFGTNQTTVAPGNVPERMRITNAGYVGIGTTAPSEMLEVSGSVKATAYLYTSDARLKKEIITLPDALTKALQLRGVNFVWRNNNEKTVGFIAQEVEAVYPELVKTDKVTGYKAVQYGNIVAILVEALKQEHEERVRSVANVAEKSEMRMNQLEKENQDLKARLEKLEKFFSEKTK